MPHSQARRPSKDQRGRSIFDRLDELKLPSIGRSITQADIDAAIGAAMEEQARRCSFFDGLDALKLPSIGRPVTKADIDAAIAEEVNARHGYLARGKTRIR